MEAVNMQKESSEGNEVLSKGKDPEPDFILTAESLVEFLDTHDILLHMTETEADVLLGYMEGHGYMLGERDGVLFRGDLCYKQDCIRWEEYSMDDAIDAACEWNYDLLKAAEAERENPDNFLDLKKKNEHYESLREDEQLLDGMFNRTKYGKEVQGLAEKLADKVIQSLNQPEGIAKTAQIIADGVEQYRASREVREEHASCQYELQEYRDREPELQQQARKVR